MTVSTALALLGLACYSALFVAVAASPMHAKDRVRRLFMASLVTMAAWQLSALVVSLASSEDLAMVAYQAMAIIVVAFSVLYTLFIRAFVAKPPSLWFSATGGVLSLAIVVSVVWARAGIYRKLVWDGTAQFYLPTYGPLALIIGMPYYALLGYVAHLLLQAYRGAQEPLHRSRLQYLLLGWCVVLVGTLANFIPPLRSYPIDLMANVVNAGLIAYAIFRYRLLDINFVVRKGLAYAIPTAVIAMVYFLTVYVVEQLLRAFVGYQVMLISLAVATITAIVAQPLRDRAQLWVDRVFFREQYDAQRMLQELSEAAASILEVSELASALETSLCETMHIRHVCVLVRDSASDCYRLARSPSHDDAPSVLRLRGDHPVVRWLADHHVPISRAQTRQVSMPGSGPPEDWGALDEVSAQLAIPLMVRDTLVGVLIVGPKLSAAPYTQDELRTLSTLANQVAIATENARLYGEAQSEIADRRNAEAALRESQGRYRSLFEASPIALWEEDLSAVRSYLRELRVSGVDDLAGHLRAHSEAVARCASLTRVVSANRATLSMYGADSVESFADGLGMVFDEGFPSVFVEGLLALEAGETEFSSEAMQRTLTGDRRHVVLRWSVVPGHEETSGMVLVSTQDVTERREREQMLRRRTARLELLRAIDEAILESHPVDQTIEMTLRSTRRLLECGGAGLVTLALTDDRVSLVALDAEDSLDPAVGDQLVPAELSGGDSETLRHLRQGSVEVVDDLEGVPYPTPVIRNLREMGYRSALLAPALHRQPQLGHCILHS